MNGFNYTILQVVPRLDSGGAERTTVEIAGATTRAGGKALVATSGGRMAPAIIKAGGQIIEMPAHAKNPVTIGANARRLGRIIREFGVDLIHARSRAPSWSAMAAARATKTPFVTTYHGAHTARGPIKRWYNSSLVRSDCVIANSQFTADAIIKAHKIDQAKIRVIPRGVDLSLFCPMLLTAKRMLDLHRNWGLQESDKGLKLLLPARLTSWKGHELAIDAVAALKSANAGSVNADLTVVFCGGAQGQPDYEKRLRKRMEERGVNNMIHLVGDCTDMPAAYNWADVVLSPSTRPEAFGRVIVEGGAMGKPVIAAAHGGALETVIDGESGILFEPGSVNGLADAIAKVSKMPEAERTVLGENGRARANSLYSAEAMCEATLNVYRSLLGNKG